MNETLTARGATIEGTSEGDRFEVRATDITLDAGDGDNSIEVDAARTYVVMGDGANTVVLNEENNTIIAGDGLNVISVFDDANAVSLGDGSNRVTITSAGNALEMGDGANRLEMGGGTNVVELGDGGNTVYGLPAADVNDGNSIISGMGSDVLTLAGSSNTLDVSDGDDTLVVVGNRNVLTAGYDLSEYDDPAMINDDDLISVRGDDNTIMAGAGSNVLYLEGRNNVYTGGDSDTIRATVSGTTFEGASDVEIEGNENAAAVTGGRLVMIGNRSEADLLSGTNGTISGSQAALRVEDSQLELDTDYALVITENSTINTSSITGASFLTTEELVLNGHVYSGTTILRMIDGVPVRAVVLNTPLTGFESVEADIINYRTATIDSVIYDIFTVASGAQSDDLGEVDVKGRVITRLGWGEGLTISEPDRYTVNGYAFDVTPDETLVGTNDWAGVRMSNAVDDILLEGTSNNDAIVNTGAGVTVDSGLGDDHISLSSAAREFLAFDADSSLDVEGFATGFESVSDVLVNGGDRRDFRFDFGITGVHITQKDAALDLINSGYESVDFLLQNNDELIKFTALNGGFTLDAADADFYALNDGATLYAGEMAPIIDGVDLPDEYLSGSTVIGSSVSSDYEFTEFILNSPIVGTYTVHGISYDSVLDSVDATGQFFVFDGDATINNYSGEGYFNALHFATDGRATVEIAEGAPINNAYKSVKSITGVSAGDHLTVGSMINGDYVDIEYTVSADGTTVIDDNGTTTWLGENPSTRNMMDVYNQNVLEERLRDLLLPVFYSNVVTDDDGLHINIAGFRQAISSRLGDFRAYLSTLENPTADDVLNMIDGALMTRFGLVLSDVVNESIIGILKGRLEADIAAQRDPIESLFGEIESEGLANFALQRLMLPLAKILGLQSAGIDIEKEFSGSESVAQGFLFDVLMPRILTNERAMRIAKDMYQYLRYSLQANVAAATDHINVILEGTAETISAGLYIGVGDVIDATGAERAFVFDSDGGNTSIMGSAGRDYIFAGAGDSINSGLGEGDLIVLTSGSSTIEVDANIPATITDLSEAFDAYVVNTVFENAHTREYVALSDASSVRVVGFETGFDAGSDVLMVGDASSLQFAFDGASIDVKNGDGVLRFEATADGAIDVMLSAGGELIKATAIDNGRSMLATTGADRYYIGADATLSGFTGTAGVNHFVLETNGSLNVVGKTVEGDAGAELKIEYIGGMSAGDTIGFVDYDGSNAIVYAVSDDGTSISRTDKNMVAWTGSASELATLNLNSVDDLQYEINSVEENMSVELGRDINLLVSVVDGESIVGTSGDDAIFAGANDTVDGNGSADLIYLEPTTTASALDAYVDGEGARQYVVLNGDATVYGFGTGFNDGSDVLMVGGDVSSLQFAFDGASVDVINGDGVMELKSSTAGAIDVLLSADGELMKATAIEGGRSAAATGADRYYIGADGTLSGFTGTAGVNHFVLETNGSLNVVGKTVEGDAGAELKIEYIGGMSAGDTIGFVDYDGSNAIMYAVSADGTSISRTDKNMVAWTGSASELATLNLNSVDDLQYEINSVEESLSAALERDINLLVSVVDGESVVGSTGDDMIFAGANDTVDGNGGGDQIYLEPTTIASALDGYVDGEGARQYVVLNGDATVRGFEAGTLASSDVLFADDPYTLRADSNGLIVENGDGSVLLMGVDADAELMIGDEIASIGGDDTTSTAPSEDTTSTEVVDSSTFIDNSVDDIDETLTGAKVGIIDTDARGNKILTAGDRNTTLANYASAVDVTFFGSPKNDSIVAGGGTQLIDISNGGRDTLDVRAGTVNVFGYNATTGSAFLVDGAFVLDGDGFSSEGLRVILDDNAPRGRFANFIGDDGSKQMYGWNYEGSVIDGSDYATPQHLLSEGWSTIKGGIRNDTIEATGGDVIQLSQGHDLIVIEAQASQEVTIDLGTHLSHSTVEGFDSNDIVKVDDVSALKVKETEEGLMLRAGKAHLTLAGVEDTVRITDGNSEFVLRTDYRDLVPTAAYMLEDEDGVIRTPDGALEIDDEIFTFNGGSDVAINGFDESWQIQAGDGIEIERVTTLVNGTIKFTTNGGSLKLRK